MTNYLVIGVYEDGYERFADDIEASDPEAAAELAAALHPGLIVAGVLNEEGQVVA